MTSSLFHHGGGKYLLSSVAQWITIGGLGCYSLFPETCRKAWTDLLAAMEIFPKRQLFVTNAAFPDEDEREKRNAPWLIPVLRDNISSFSNDSGSGIATVVIALAGGLWLSSTIASTAFRRFNAPSKGHKIEDDTSKGWLFLRELNALREDTLVLREKVKTLEAAVVQSRTDGFEVQANVDLLVAAVEPMIPGEHGSLVFEMERYNRDGPLVDGGLPNYQQHDDNGDDIIDRDIGDDIVDDDVDDDDVDDIGDDDIGDDDIGDDDVDIGDDSGVDDVDSGVDDVDIGNDDVDIGDDDVDDALVDNPAFLPLQ